MTISKFKGFGFALAFAIVASIATPASAVLVYSLTDENDLQLFDSASPVDVLSAGAIQGLGSQDLIGIDLRPADGQLYAVGNLGGVFRINPATYVATQISTLNVGLSGSRFGFDFNPIVDRLRIVSNTDQSLAVNVDTGVTVVNGSLVYGAANPATAIGDNPSVSASAYINSIAPSPGNPTGMGTVLYDIDFRSSEDRLVIQDTNTGVLTVVGPLGVNASNVSGFDIYFNGQTNIGLAALQETSGGINRLYTINLTTGAATLVDDIGGGDMLDGLTVANVIPEPGTIVMAAIGTIAMGLIGFRRRRA